MGPVAAWAISSIEQIDMVLAVKMTPFRPAARAATASPRGQNIPVNPVGARISGEAIGMPRTVVDWSRTADVHERPRPEPVALEVGRVGAHRDLVFGATVDVVEQCPRQP